MLLSLSRPRCNDRPIVAMSVGRWKLKANADQFVTLRLKLISVHRSKVGTTRTREDSGEAIGARILVGASEDNGADSTGVGEGGSCGSQLSSVIIGDESGMILSHARVHGSRLGAARCSRRDASPRAAGVAFESTAGGAAAVEHEGSEESVESTAGESDTSGCKGTRRARAQGNPGRTVSRRPPSLAAAVACVPSLTAVLRRCAPSLHAAPCPPCCSLLTAPSAGSASLLSSPHAPPQPTLLSSRCIPSLALPSV